MKVAENLTRYLANLRLCAVRRHVEYVRTLRAMTPLRSILDYPLLGLHVAAPTTEEWQDFVTTSFDPITQAMNAQHRRITRALESLDELSNEIAMLDASIKSRRGAHERRMELRRAYYEVSPSAAVRAAFAEMQRTTDETELQLDKMVSLSMATDRENNATHVERKASSGEVFERVLRTETDAGATLNRLTEAFFRLEAVMVTQHQRQLDDATADRVTVFDDEDNVLCDIECSNFASRPKDMSKNELIQLESLAGIDFFVFKRQFRERFRRTIRRQELLEIDRAALTLRQTGVEYRKLRGAAESAMDDIDGARAQALQNNDAFETKKDADDDDAYPEEVQAMLVKAERFKLSILEPMRVRFVDTLVTHYPSAFDAARAEAKATAWAEDRISPGVVQEIREKMPINDRDVRQKRQAIVAFCEKNRLRLCMSLTLIGLVIQMTLARALSKDASLADVERAVQRLITAHDMYDDTNLRGAAGVSETFERFFKWARVASLPLGAQFGNSVAALSSSSWSSSLLNAVEGPMIPDPSSFGLLCLEEVALHVALRTRTAQVKRRFLKDHTTF